METYWKSITLYVCIFWTFSHGKNPAIADFAIDTVQSVLRVLSRIFYMQL